MRLGFTGTREGMTERQKEKFLIFIRSFKPNEFHHGDCIGADEEAHQIVAREMGLGIIITHPPEIDKYRAFCKSYYEREPKPYLKRDLEIVKESDIIIATPKEFNEILRSGTWATIRRARKHNGILIIYPNGNIEFSGGITTEIISSWLSFDL